MARGRQSTAGGRGRRPRGPALTLALLGGARAAPDPALAAEGPYLLPLRRAFTQGPDGVAKSFYVGHISVGLEPQRLRAAFDTASGLVVLPSAKCRSLACVERRRYVPQASSTATDINADGSLVQQGLRLANRLVQRDAITIGISNLDLGDGMVTGELMREVVCLGTGPGSGLRRGACAEMGILAATDMTEVPFHAMPHDGTIGLSLSGLSISPAFSFLGLFADAEHRRPAQFGIFLGAKAGEIAFGGHNAARLQSPLQWSPVLRPEAGYWQVRILAIRAGNRTIESCRGPHGCRGIIDTCASRLGVPASMVPGFEAALAAPEAAMRPAAFRGFVPGGCQGPDLHIDLEGLTLTLRAEDYAHPPSCRPQVAPMELPEEFAGAFLLGEQVLQRYYTVYDATTKQVGFGLAAAAGAGAQPEKDLPEEPPPGLELPAGAQAAEQQQMASEARSLTLLLMQALVMQASVVLVLSIIGTYLRSTQVFVTRLSSVLARSGLLSKGTGLVADLLPGEVPTSLECVICLGSCAEECCVAAGDGSAAGGGGGPRPRWCRLQCGHHFHRECVLEWLWQVPRCPVCRCHVLEGGRAAAAAPPPSPPAPEPPRAAS